MFLTLQENKSQLKISNLQISCQILSLHLLMRAYNVFHNKLRETLVGKNNTAGRCQLPGFRPLHCWGYNVSYCSKSYHLMLNYVWAVSALAWYTLRTLIQTCSISNLCKHITITDSPWTRTAHSMTACCPLWAMATSPPMYGRIPSSSMVSTTVIRATATGQTSFF